MEAYDKYYIHLLDLEEVEWQVSNNGTLIKMYSLLQIPAMDILRKNR